MDRKKVLRVLWQNHGRWCFEIRSPAEPRVENFWFELRSEIMKPIGTTI